MPGQGHAAFYAAKAKKKRKEEKRLQRLFFIPILYKTDMDLSKGKTPRPDPRVFFRLSFEKKESFKKLLELFQDIRMSRFPCPVCKCFGRCMDPEHKHSLKLQNEIAASVLMFLYKNEILKF